MREKRFMKKKLATILTVIMCLGLVLTGCSGNTKKEEKKDEPQYADEQFIKDMAKGLEARWTLNEQDENKDGYDAIELQSDEYKKMMLSYIQAELDCVEKYKDEKFENSKLQEKAISYINILNKNKEICDYIPVDYYGKYSDEFDPLYAERSKIIEEMANDYGLTVSEKFQSYLDEFKARSQIVKEQDALQSSIDTMLANVQFTEVNDDGFGWKKYQAVIENTTGKDFSTFSVNINLMSADGVIVETQYDSVSNFTNGAKAQFEFTTDKEFASTEVTANWYE